MFNKNDLSSNKNKMSLNPFVLECQRFSELAMRYNGQYHSLNIKLSKEIVTEEYSTGGELLHRGYYCPSPILDIVVGNCNRGRLLKHLTRKNKPSYRYGFNNEGKLILVDQINLNSHEFIFYNNESEIGITFLGNDGIQSLSECKSCNHQIQSYIFCLYHPVENHIIEYVKEDYAYSETKLCKTNVYRFVNERDGLLLRREEYAFKHDSDGYLSHYTVTEYDGNSIKPSIWDGHEFDIKIKRKV